MSLFEPIKFVIFEFEDFWYSVTYNLIDEDNQDFLDVLQEAYSLLYTTKPLWYVRLQGTHGHAIRVSRDETVPSAVPLPKNLTDKVVQLVVGYGPEHDSELYYNSRVSNTHRAIILKDLQAITEMTATSMTVLE